MITVTPVAPGEQAAALRLLFHELPAAEQDARVAQLLAASSEGGIPLDGLLVAYCDGEPCGLGISAIQPDRSLLIWPPVVVPGHPVEPVSDAILQAMGAAMDAAGATLGQCLLLPEETADRERLDRNGFPHLTDLLFLRRPLSEPLAGTFPSGVVREQFDPPRNGGRFAATLEQTYVGTLDCPALNGARSGAEALRGHQTAGRFAAERWFLYREGERDLGLLLLSEHPEQRSWELVYMGLVPDARGRGLGRLLVIDGLETARTAAAEAVFLAVDSKNRYARKTYADLGFVVTERRSVHIRLPRERGGK